MNSIRIFLQKHYKKILLSSLLSLAFSLSVYIIFFQHPNLVGKKEIGLSLIFGIVTFFLIFFFLKRIYLLGWQEQKKEIQWSASIGAVILAFFLLLQINIWRPIYLNFLLPQHNLEIIPYRYTDGSSTGNIIRLATFNYGLGEVDLSQLKAEDGWNYQNGQWMFSGHEPGRLRWQGRIIGKASIMFPTMPDGGEIKVFWDGQETDYSLKSQDSGSVLFVTRQEISWFNYFLANISLLLALSFVIWIICCLYLRVSGFMKIRKSNSNINQNPFKVGLILCFPMIIVWGLYWTVFFPAIMSQDSVGQWQQALDGQINDWAPAIHTIFLSFTQKMAGNPGLFTAIQVLFFSFVVSWGLTQLVIHGLPLKIGLLFSLLYAISPVNSIYSITIWKDVPYAIFLFCITIQVFCILVSHGKWLDNPLNLIGFGMSSAMVMIFRHNGIPIPILLFLSLLPIFRNRWKKISACFVLMLVVFILITGPLYSIFNVQKISGNLGNTILLHHIGAHVQAGTPMAEDDEQLLNNLLPLSKWNYDCCCNNSIYYAPEFDKTSFSINGDKIQKLFLTLFLRNPMVDVQHITCSSSVIYSIHPTCYNYTTSLSILSEEVHWITSPQIIPEESLLPGLKRPLFDFYYSSYQPGLFSLFWRPALAFFIGIIFLLLIILKKKEAVWLLIGTPMLIQTAIMYFVNLAQDFRYFFSTGLITLFLCAVFTWTFFENHEDDELIIKET